ncbi:MAG: hypothetical protein WA210_14370 [Burkholderiaceae bacterium]
MALSRIKSWIAEILYASDLNAEFNNILNNALSLISPLTGNLAAGGNKITGLGAPTALTDAARLGDTITNLATFYTTTGTQPAYVLTPSPAITAYAAGQEFLILVHSAQTSDAPTINVSAVGAKNLLSPDGTALNEYALQASALYRIVYDGTGFRVLTPTLAGSRLYEVKQFATSASVEFTFPTGYDLAGYRGRDIIPAVQDEALQAQVSIAAAYQTAGSYTNNYRDISNGVLGDTLSTTDTAIVIAGGSDDNGAHGISFRVDLESSPHGTALNKVFHYRSYAVSSGGTRTSRDGDGYWGAAQSAIDKIRFNFSGGGNGTSGVVIAEYTRTGL